MWSTGSAAQAPGNDCGHGRADRSKVDVAGLLTDWRCRAAWRHGASGPGHGPLPLGSCSATGSARRRPTTNAPPSPRPADLHEGRKCGVDPSRRAATLPVGRIGSRAPLAPAEGHRPEKPPHQGEQNQARHTRVERAPPITGVLNEKATEQQQPQDRAGKKPCPSRQALQADAHALIVPRPAWPPWRSPAVGWPPTTQLDDVGTGLSLVVFIPHPASAGDWAIYAADVSARLSTVAFSR